MVAPVAVVPAVAVRQAAVAAPLPLEGKAGVAVARRQQQLMLAMAEVAERQDRLVGDAAAL